MGDTSLNIEALAVALAWEGVWDHVMGEFWYGYPDSENDDEMRESMESHLPRAREKAAGYVAILTNQTTEREKM